METSPFAEWLHEQRRLQVEAFDRDPAWLSGDARADFMIWNAWALEDELHEAMQEVMWKPWLTVDRGAIIDTEAFIGEIVDVMHFLGNLLLCAMDLADEDDGTVDDLADNLWAAYQRKLDKNLARQREGYDGLKNKCPICKREMSEEPSTGDRGTVMVCSEHGWFPKEQV